MKRLRILNRVYDMQEQEYIQRTYLWDVTDEEVEVLNRIFSRMKPLIGGFGEDGLEERDCYASPLFETSKSGKDRFRMLTDFGVIDYDEDDQINGIIDL